MYTVPFSEDFELFWQLSRKYKIYNLPAVLLDYRVTDQSLHQVLKKKEYEAAQQLQLLRNFRYYAGESYTIPESFIECLQHNFEPLLLENNISRIVACLSELDFLTQKILATENINRDVNAIKEAAFFKRKFIIEFFVKHLKAPKGILLLMNLRENFMLERYIKDSIKKIIFRKKQNVQP